GLPRSGLRGASPTLSLLSAVPIRAANLAPLVVAYQLRITLATDPSRAGRLALLKPSGRLFRVLISPRTRVRTPKVDPDASVLRLEKSPTRPLGRGGDRTRERIRAEPGPRRHGCARAAGTERDPRRSRERIAGFLRLGRAAS